MKSENVNASMAKRPLYKSLIPQSGEKNVKAYVSNTNHNTPEKKPQENKSSSSPYNALLIANRKYKVSAPCSPKKLFQLNKKSATLQTQEDKSQIFTKTARHGDHSSFGHEGDDTNPTIEKEFEDITEARVKLAAETLKKQEQSPLIGYHAREYTKFIENSKDKKGENYNLLKEMTSQAQMLQNRRTFPNFSEIPIKKDSPKKYFAYQQNIPSTKNTTHFPRLDQRNHTPCKPTRNENESISPSKPKTLPKSRSSSTCRPQKCLSQRTLNKIENENPESSPFKVNLEAANYATPNLTPKKVSVTLTRPTEGEEDKDDRKPTIPRYQYNVKGKLMFNQLVNVNTPQRQQPSVKNVNNSVNKGYSNISALNASHVGISDSKAAIENYVYERIIGQGSYAIVRLATDKTTNQKVAIKTYEKFKLFDVNRRKNVKREVDILKELDHPCIIKLIKSIDTIGQV